MKKTGLCAFALLSVLAFGGCSAGGKTPICNLSAYRFYHDAYAIQYENAIYFISFYDNLYFLRDSTVTLLEEDFNAWSMTRLGDTLYYLAPGSNGNAVFCARKLSKDGPLGEPETLYAFSGSPNRAWTDGESIFVLGSKEVIRIPLDGGTEDCWPVEDGLLFSALVWDGKIYLNRKEAESYSLFSVDLATGEEQRVANGPAIAYGVLDGEVCIWDGTDDGSPVPLTTGANITYYYKRSRDGAQNMLDIYVKENDAYTLAASIPENSSLISPAVYQAGDSLLIRSFYPAEVDRNLTGEKPYGSAAYQYLLEPDGTLTLLLKEEIETPLS